MKKLLIVMSIVCVCAGCRHGDSDSAWTEIKTEGGYKYLVWEQGQNPESLIAVFPGLAGGYEKEIGDALRKRMAAVKSPGVIVLPHMEYKNPEVAEFVRRKVVETVNSIPHSGLSLAGISAGASFALNVSGDLDVRKILLLSAGAYKKGGGTPSDELPEPSADEMKLIEGYDVSILAKYGILYDGTVFVDPAKRLAERTGSEILLLPGVDHGGTVKELRKRPAIIDWIVNP